MNPAPVRKLKVALMTYAMDNRQGKGTALYARKLTERFVNDDRLDVTLVHYEHVDDPLYTKAHEIIMPRLRLPLATHFIRQLLFFWKYRNRKFDIIHWFQPRVYPLFWLAPARHLIVTAYCAGDITTPGAYPLSRHMFNYSLKHFNRKLSAVIASSQFGKEEIIQYYGADPARVHCTYLGGGEDYKSLPKGSALQLVHAKYAIRAPFILDISRHIAHKNIVSVVKAYDHLKNTTAFPHELVIVGFRGEDSGRIEAVAQASKHKDQIRFINYVDSEDLNMLYSAADVFVFPSLNEGFGFPVVEALASGTPVVTSNVTSPPEIAGDAAITVDPRDVLALADGIRRILTDAALSQSLRERGLARAKDFTWKRTAEETVKLYQRILSSNGGIP